MPNLRAPSLCGSTPVSETKSAPPNDQTPCSFGPFVLERRIAVGGSAEVFRARPQNGTRPAPEFVIKRLLPLERRADQFQTLSREAELHRAVTHPNVVTVFGAGMVGSEAYLAMEYVHGVDLHRLLRALAREQRRLEPNVAAYITRSVALALHAVHSARDESGAQLNIRHGDISPSNIYLSLNGEVKLGDFGVARTSLGMAPETAEVLKGKFGYLAPEQLLGNHCDQRSDIFALGVVFGEMLLGGKIFAGSGRLAVSLSIREGNIEPLRRAADRLPPRAVEVCLRALECDPQARYQDARALAEALEPELDASAARASLAERVEWARDCGVVARQFEQRLRHAASGRAASIAPQPEGSSVRREGKLIQRGVSFSELLELAASGQLRADDEVSLMGEAFRKVSAVEELARYLGASTTTTTAQLFQPGVPDFTTELSETQMLDVLARMRMRKESGALFVTRVTAAGTPERKDIYLASGRLLHVASTERGELLGEYALRLQLITREQLDLALSSLSSYHGRLEGALLGLGLMDSKVLFRAIRNYGRDRVAALCGWREGSVQFYRGSEPGPVQFPLELDLTVPMMAGAMLMARQGARSLGAVARLHPGRRLSDEAGLLENVEIPRSLRMLLESSSASPSLKDALAQLETKSQTQQRAVQPHEARAAVMVALALEWVRAE